MRSRDANATHRTILMIRGLCPMKLLPASLVFALTVNAGCCTSPPALPIAPDSTDTHVLIEQAISSTVAMTSTDGETTLVYCSGVWVSHDSFLTADHCARTVMESALGIDADNPIHRSLLRALLSTTKVNFIVKEDGYEMFNKPKRERSGVIVKTSYELDLALISVPEEDIPPMHGVVKLSQTGAIQGEMVNLMGHPGGMPWSFSRGFVSAERKLFPPAKALVGPWYQIDGAAWKGSSGGGAFNDRGELVGIASFLTIAPGHVMFVHDSTIRAFLASALPQKL